MKTILNLWLIACVCLGMIACGGSDNGNEGDGELGGVNDGSLVLKPSVTKITTSKYDVVSFIVELNGKDVTKDARIKESGGEFVKNASFSSAEAGKYEFKASYNGKLSAPVTVTVEKEILFRKNLLMQEFTSIECSNCPAMASNISYYQSLYPEQIITIAYHGILNGEYEEPMAIYTYIQPIATRFNTFQSYPAAALDQTRLWSRNGDVAELDAKEFLSKPGTVGIAIESRLSGQLLTVKVKVKSTEIFQNKCRLAVVLVENKLISPQLKNDGINKEFWVDNYEHNHVVRKYLTDVWGDLQEAGAIERGKELQKDFTYTFPDNSQFPEEVKKLHPENMEIVVYVTDAANDRVINSQIVKLGESVDYVMENK